MTKKFLILSILTIIFGLGVVFVSQKQEPAIKETSTVEVDPDKKVCTGFAKWTKDGEFKTIRSECITEKEYQDALNAPDYLCNYYLKNTSELIEIAKKKTTFDSYYPIRSHVKYIIELITRKFK